MAKKFVTYLPLILLCIVAIASLSFSEVKHASLRCTDVLISIEKNPSHSDFINIEDVYAAMNANRNMLIGKEVSEIDIHKIESTLESNPTILSCETYFTLKGELCVKIKQRTPIVRILSLHSSYYLDENGVMMPLSERGSSRVLVASGEIFTDYQPGVNVRDSANLKLLQDVFSLAQDIRSDSLFLPMIEQIYVMPKREFVLTTKVGPSKIEFGTIDDKDVKFRHIIAFYKAEKVKENWDQYVSLSLKYKNQIVCTKK